jgi:hypothetical protein
MLKTLRKLIAFISVCLFLAFIACDRNQRHAGCFDYPKQIDSLQVRDLYDSARLYIFTWLCDRKIDDYYRGQFELKYKSFFMRNDSLELFFLHSLPKELRDSTISGYVHHASIAFNIKTKQKLWGWDINGFSDKLEAGDTRFESAASAEVLDFIRTHKHILNPCFLELLQRKNLLAN